MFFKQQNARAVVLQPVILKTRIAIVVRVVVSANPAFRELTVLLIFVPQPDVVTTGGVLLAILVASPPSL